MEKKEKWEIIAKEYVVSLFPIFMLVDGFVNGTARKIVKAKLDLAFKIENNNVTFYNHPTNWRRAHIKLVKRVKEDLAFLSRIFKSINTESRKLVAYTEKILKLNLTRLSAKKIYNLYYQYILLNTNVYSYGLALPLLDFQDDIFLSNELNRFLRQKNAEQYFSTLTTPSLDTYNKLHELELLEIYYIIKRDNQLLQLFEKVNTSELSPILKNKYKKIWNLINRHTKKFAWVHYVYEGPAATPGYFIDIIKDFIRRNLDPQKELEDYQREKQALKLQQKRIIAELKPNKYFHQIINMAQQVVYYKVYRRDLQTWSYYNLEPLLKEIANRLALTLKQVRMMLPEEVEAALLSNKLDIDLLNQRLKLVVYGREGIKRYCLVGTDAKKFLEDVKQEKVNKNIKQIMGTTAYAGKAKGVVKIINTPDDMIKMSAGNILVSASTNPNLMPAIRQAAAIITDEGGLTCHAAIVSRELKIPCIIGTKVATRVLKDGDLVEVDATRGVIRLD
jgi:phosphohistidine swiveling domain-containing protein